MRGERRGSLAPVRGMMRGRWWWWWRRRYRRRVRRPPPPAAAAFLEAKDKASQEESRITAPQGGGKKEAFYMWMSVTQGHYRDGSCSGQALSFHFLFFF